MMYLLKVTYRSDGPGVKFPIICIVYFHVLIEMYNTCHYNKQLTYLLTYLKCTVIA